MTPPPIMDWNCSHINIGSESNHGSKCKRTTGIYDMYECAVDYNVVIGQTCTTCYVMIATQCCCAYYSDRSDLS